MICILDFTWIICLLSFTFYLSYSTVKYWAGETDGQRVGSCEIVKHGQDSLRQLSGFHDRDGGGGGDGGFW